MVEKNKKAEACETKNCCGCNLFAWLIPLVVIALVWIWPAATWSKITITVLMALAILAHNCPCKKK